MNADLLEEIRRTQQAQRELQEWLFVLESLLDAVEEGRTNGAVTVI
jgi:hypothetical protein